MSSVAPSAVVNVAPPSDEDLLLRYRETLDHDAFELLVHRYERELYNYLARYTHDASLAEEVFQQTFLRLHEKRTAYEPGRPVRPWIYSIATHLAVDAMRRAGRRRTFSLDEEHDSGDEASTSLRELLDDASVEPLAQLSDDERHAWARRAVDELPGHLRDVVLLVYFQGLRYQEAADVLGVPLGTVKSRLNNALVRLHSAWRRSHRDATEE